MSPVITGNFKKLAPGLVIFPLSNLCCNMIIIYCLAIKRITKGKIAYFIFKIMGKYSKLDLIVFIFFSNSLES